MLLSAVSREQKRKVGEAIRESNEKMVREKRLKKKRPAIHKHSRTAATLAVTDSGFTLCIGGTWSLAMDGVVRDRDLVKCVESGRVRLLHCFDEKTAARWKGAAAAYKKRISVRLLDPTFLKKDCTFCNDRKCHRWKAVAGMSEKYGLPFDPIKH